MKKIILGMVLSLAVSIGFAEQPLITSKSPPEKLKSIKAKEEELKESYCMIVLSLAEASIKAKQAGTPIKKSIEVSKQYFSDDDTLNLRIILKELIMDAYSQPDYLSEEYKKRQLNEFTSKHYLNCMSAAGLR
ncbi:hypothetical protein [Acinetobacter guerrae]|uniref:hypothetical protein n=1 Tax=Acinetobacter guerrae TaxID=1843371 RepID=UPI00125F8A4B|nr:hypothetical protein [Acinetobacter guerrae]